MNWEYSLAAELEGQSDQHVDVILQFCSSLCRCAFYTVNWRSIMVTAYLPLQRVIVADPGGRAV
jgi:hypothetical protein